MRHNPCCILLLRSPPLPVSHARVSSLTRRGNRVSRGEPGYPELEAKVRDVIGLYLAPLDNAVVSIAEKRQIKAWPPAGLMTTPGTAPPRCSPPWKRPPGRPPRTPATRHRHQEFLRFLKQAAAHPGKDLHVVLDNYGTHKHPGTRQSRIHAA